jgi:hypothetical protein
MDYSASVARYRLGSRMVVAIKQSAPAGSRWDRGIKRPNEVKLAALGVLLEREPGLSKAELCRRTGIGRSTLPYYLRALGGAVAAAASKNAEVKERAALTHLGLLDRVLSAADEVRSEIAKLTSSQPDPTIAQAVFRGHATLNQIHRLVGELLGDIAPPTTNIYLTKLDAFLSAPVQPGQLSPALRAAIAETTHDDEPVC